MASMVAEAPADEQRAAQRVPDEPSLVNTSVVHDDAMLVVEPSLANVGNDTFRTKWQQCMRCSSIADVCVCAS